VWEGFLGRWLREKVLIVDGLWFTMNERKELLSFQVTPSEKECCG